MKAEVAETLPVPLVQRFLVREGLRPGNGDSPNHLSMYCLINPQGKPIC